MQVQIYSDWPAMATQYSFYTMVADSYVYEGTAKNVPSAGKWQGLFQHEIKNTTQFPVIVDSGTTLLYLPTELAEDVLNLYDPPAVYVEDEGGYFALCNASVPEFGVEIGGKVFWISEADSMHRHHSGLCNQGAGHLLTRFTVLMQGQYFTDDAGDNYCLTGPQDGEGGPYILGDTFLNNVVVVFDVGASQMRFAAHDY
jgi:hypothetical protein